MEVIQRHASVAFQMDLL